MQLEEGQRLADEWGVPFIESSAKYNTNVEEVICMYVCMYVYTYMYVCMYVCVYVCT